MLVHGPAGARVPSLLGQEHDARMVQHCRRRQRVLSRVELGRCPVRRVKLRCLSLDVVQVQAIPVPRPGQGHAPAPRRGHVDVRGAWPADDRLSHRHADITSTLHLLRPDQHGRAVHGQARNPEDLVGVPRRLGRAQRMSPQERDNSVRSAQLVVHMVSGRVEAATRPSRDHTVDRVRLAGGSLQSRCHGAERWSSGTRRRRRDDQPQRQGRQSDQQRPVRTGSGLPDRAPAPSEDHRTPRYLNCNVDGQDVAWALAKVLLRCSPPTTLPARGTGRAAPCASCPATLRFPSGKLM